MSESLNRLPPVVVDLGKIKNKRIKQLKKGEGRLIGEVDDAVAAVCQELGDEVEGKIVLPVVVVYRKRPKRRRPFFRL